MKRLWIWAALALVSMFMAPANAGDITMTWTDVQNGYDAVLNLQWTTGNVHSPEADTEGSSIYYSIRANTPDHAVGDSTMDANEDFIVAVVDPANGGPGFTRAWFAYDQDGNWDIKW